MAKTVCAACGETGGRFIYRGEKWYHADRCTAPVGIRDTAKSTFPYVTNHFEPNDGPVTIQNIQHLRRLENLHGVASDVYNNDRGPQGDRY